MKIFSIAVSLFLLTLSSGSMAETPGTMAQEAQQAYQSGDYPRAMQRWEELRSLGYFNGPIFYNLGNAAWQLGQGGRARWYFLRGVALDPRNDALRHNLKFVEDKLGLNKGELPDGPLGYLQSLPWWKLSVNFFEILRAAAILSLIYFGILFLKKRGGNSASPWIKWGLGIPLILLFGLVLFQGKRLYFNRDSVVLNPGTPLLSAPSLEAASGQTLAEGQIVRVQKKQGDFRLVKVPQSNPAWVEANKLGNLSL